MQRFTQVKGRNREGFSCDRESYTVGLPGELRRRNIIMGGKRLTLRHRDAISSHLHFDLMHLNGAIYFIFLVCAMLLSIYHANEAN